MRRSNHLIRECPKPPRIKNQRAFVGGIWSESGEDEEEMTKDETCLVAQASNEFKDRNPGKSEKRHRKCSGIEYLLI
ncbi:hypothetical protein Tco_0886326 [Tanacetum coccineum]